MHICVGPKNCEQFLRVVLNMHKEIKAAAQQEDSFMLRTN